MAKNPLSSPLLYGPIAFRPAGGSIPKVKYTLSLPNGRKVKPAGQKKGK